MSLKKFAKAFKGGFNYSAGDDKKRKGNKWKNNIAFDQIESLNNDKWGIYFTVNKFPPGKRKKSDCKFIRAVFIEDDYSGKQQKKFPLPPSIVVESSPNKFHYYWLTHTKEFDEYELVMQTMVDKYNCDPKARDISRVLRLPGTYHHKRKPFKVKIVGGNFKQYDWEAIKIAFPPADRKKSNYSKSEKGTFDLQTAFQDLTTTNDLHGSMIAIALHFANQNIKKSSFYAIMEVAHKAIDFTGLDQQRIKDVADRFTEAHLDECWDSAVAIIESEDEGENYKISKIHHSHEHVIAPKLSEKIIAPENTVIGDLTRALNKTWWTPNILLSGLAARSIVAYLAGGKYKSNLGDRLNIQQVAIGETGCGKDILFNQIHSVIDLIFTDPEQNKLLNNGVCDEVGSAEGLDRKLRTCGNKHDVIWLQDEIGGLMQSAKKESRTQNIFNMLLKFYTKSDEKVTERALMNNKLKKEDAKVLYAPHIILSGATTPSLITKGLDSSFLEYGSASRMLFFPATQYEEKALRKRGKLKLNTRIVTNLRKVAEQKDKENQLFKYPHKRLQNPEQVMFTKKAMDFAYDEGVRIRNDKKLNKNVWNRYVANAKKYAMIDAIAENPDNPIVSLKMLKRNFELVKHACEYTCDLFENEVGETENDTAKNKVLILMKKYAVNGRVVTMKDINNIRAMRAIRVNERYALLKELENDGTITMIEKKNAHGKITKTFKLNEKGE